jgi:hypothetical protein
MLKPLSSFGFSVDDVSLSHSSLPNEGFVKILTKYSGNQSVCWESLKNSADDVVCRQMGYKRSASHVSQSAPSDVKNEIFSGSINCNGEEKYLSRCAIDASRNRKSCSELTYIKCRFRINIHTYNLYSNLYYCITGIGTKGRGITLQSFLYFRFYVFQSTVST